MTTLFTDPLSDLEFSLDETQAAELSSKLLQVLLDEPLISGESSKQLVWLVSDFAVKADLNKAGLQKANKEKVALGPDGKKVYQMEVRKLNVMKIAFDWIFFFLKDQTLVSCPFDDDIHQGLFAVFDGHVDKNAAIEAKNQLPIVCKQRIPNEDYVLNSFSIRFYQKL